MTKTDKLIIFLTALGMLGALFIFYGSFTAQQATIETQLTIIQRDITELSVAVNVGNRNHEAAIKELRELIATLETKIAQYGIKIQNLERRIDLLPLTGG